MGFRRTALLVGIALLAAGPILAQGAPTAKVSGEVSSGGQALPGVTVVFESDQLQGQRVLVTDANGQYSSPPLPPGEYEISFSLDSFQPVVVKRRFGASMNVVINAELPSSTVSEEIVITGEAVEAISEGTTSATTMTQEDLENLPVARTFNAAVGMAPGVHTTGPSDNITISGAQSWENLFTLNGVVLNENLRGQAFDLFIEDAIQETTTASAGITAEFGRFTGGVVTAITKSGGNKFEGSLRQSQTNEDWKSDNALSPERIDVVNRVNEATVGGRIVRDRVWFFAAGRDSETDQQDQSLFTNIPFSQTFTEERTEGKLTASLTASHQLQATRTEIEEDQTNIAHGGCCDALVINDGTIDPIRSLPQELEVFNYTGILNQNFFVEAQVSERKFTFDGTGGQDESIGGGSPSWDATRGVWFNESLFCDNTVNTRCTPENRDNDASRLKGSYFLSTANSGSHDLSFGAETFEDITRSNNFQSPSGYQTWSFIGATIDGESAFPNFAPGASFLAHRPILNPAAPTDFSTDSLFVNDRLRLNDKWSLNIGFRYDEVGATNSFGFKVADSDLISHRLGATWDVRGDGQWVLNFGANRYSGPTASNIFDASSGAGSSAIFLYNYLGPPIGPVFGNPLPGDQATDAAFDWLRSVCPGALPTDALFTAPDLSTCAPGVLDSIEIPGASTVLDAGLETTSADEFSVGFTHPLGNRGLVRVDYIKREFGNFFLERIDTATGTVTFPDGTQGDQGLIVNDDSLLQRDYDAVEVAYNLRFLNNRLRVGGNGTWSHARGNLDGETQGAGPISDDFGEYPEYQDLAWNAPVGDVGIDQRIRVRTWAMYDVINSDRNYLNVSLLQNFFSGTPYSAFGSIDTRPFVTNPGYLSPPTSVTYYFSGRGAFTTDDITRTDLALNYSFKFNRFEFFVQPEMLNVFNEEGSVLEDNTVFTALNDGSLQSFDPFTETPVEGVHYRRGDDFGQPLREDDLQRPREFRFSVGFRINPN